MNILYEERFRELSEKAKDAIVSGDIGMYSSVHKQMAEIFHRETDYPDEIKSRMVAYHCDLSGSGGRVWIDRQNIEGIGSAASQYGAGEKELHDIFFGVIRKDMTPRHSMTVKGSYKLLTLLLQNKEKKVNSIVENLR